MDYKQVVEVIRWHSLYSNFNSAESRIFMYMSSTANYKTSKLSVSYSEISTMLRIAKSTVAKAIDGLEKKKAISIENESGRKSKLYKVRSTEELNAFFIVQSKNKLFEDWHTREQQFQIIKDKHSEVGEDCEECDDDDLCPMHKYHQSKIESSTEWREYQLWLYDNPRPELWVNTINGIIVDSQ